MYTKVHPTIKTNISGGWQDFALQGWNDSGHLDLNVIETDHNGGNYNL